MINAFNNYDPFLDQDNEITHKIHLRCQARNGRKCISTIQGLPADIELKKMLKTFKKKFSCNGSIKEDTELGNIIQLSGDQRANIKDYLVTNKLVDKDNIVKHGI
jgi:translation initiation factor 1